MIQSQTFVKVADNTGAKTLMCIHITSSKSKFAYLGDVFIGVVKFRFTVFFIYKF